MSKDFVVSPKQREKDEEDRRIAERDRKLAVFAPGLVASGDIDMRSKEEMQAAALLGAPNYVHDLAILCHKRGCGAPIGAITYHAFVNESRFMLWIEGFCPRCMERRKTIFDPMVGMEAKAKMRAEQDAILESWRKELTPEESEDEVGVVGARGVA